MNVQINSSMQPKLMYIYLNGWWLEFVANASRMKYCSICAVVSHTVPRIYPQMHGCTWPAAGWEWRKKKPLNAAVFMWSFFLLLLEEDLRIGGWTTIRDAYFFFPFIYLFVFVRGWHLKNAKCSQPINEQQNSRYAKRLPPAAEQKKQTNKNCQIYIDGFVVWAAAVVHEHHIA